METAFPSRHSRVSGNDGKYWCEEQSMKRNRKPDRKRTGTSLKRRLRKAVIVAVLVVLAGPPLGVVFFRVVPPLLTPLMVIRLFEGEGLDKDWTTLEDISPHLRAAIIAGEDNLFCEHFGFDLESLQDAVEDWASGDRLRGASTLSMQTSKNLLLWPGRSLLRKGFEAYTTVWLEMLWPKTRIAEVYLNIAEWGPGLYGAEAAARHHFGVPAAKLSRNQAALLAAVLPNPRAWSAGKPSDYIRKRARTLRLRMKQLGPRLACIGGKP